MRPPTPKDKTPLTHTHRCSYAHKLTANSAIPVPVVGLPSAGERLMLNRQQGVCRSGLHQHGQLSHGLACAVQPYLLPLLPTCIHTPFAPPPTESTPWTPVHCGDRRRSARVAAARCRRRRATISSAARHP